MTIKPTDDLAPTPQLLKIKSKYFAAWRKYTLKKRKQQNQLMSSSVSIVSSTTDLNPDINTQKITSVKTALKDLNQYDYDLKSKWLKQCLFCPSSRSVRQLTCNLLQNIFNFYSNTSFVNNPLVNSDPQSSTNNLKKFQIAELLNQYLEECGSAGECFNEYLQLLKHVINDRECKYRLVLRSGILNTIENLLHKEIKYLSELERLSEL